jgi:hypothetical protein
VTAETGEEKTTSATRTPRSVINEAIRETAAFSAMNY